jgi:glycosyltransferase involved in cell wall biosynthesis
MRVAWFLRRIHRVPSVLYYRFRKFILPIPISAALSLINRFKRSPITRAGGPVISLTTHGGRIHSVHIAIESIGTGDHLPSRIILWLDDKPLFDSLPPTIRRLEARGLEVKLCQNYGPHTKYYPYVESQETFDAPLVIADDDQIYRRDWLRKLVEAHQEYPDVVNCHWALVVAVDDERVASYQSWKRRGSIVPSLRQFALGVSGVIYPSAVQELLKKAGPRFQDCCPKADDVWLHAQAIRGGFKVRQVRSKERESLDIPGSQKIGLWKNNDYGGGNDHQIEATYTVEDIRMLSK